MSSKSPFWLQLGSRESPHASHPETEIKHCLRCNQHWAARAAWVQCELSNPRHDPKTGEFARSSRRRAQPLLLSHCRSKDNRACLPGPPWNSSWEGATHSMQAANWVRTRNCSRSLNLVPNSNGSRSPLSSGCATPWEGPKWSPPLVPNTVLSKAVKGHCTQEFCVGPLSILGQMVLRTSTFGLEARECIARL